MSRRNADVKRVEREARWVAIRRCRRCDPSGWKLGMDGTPIDPAVRCQHGAAPAPPAVRDITEPIHDNQERLEW